MASDGEGGGESEMSWYAEVILSHIIIEKQSYGKAARQSTYRCKPFFFFLTTFQSSLDH